MVDCLIVNELKKLPLGCLAALLIAITIWVALQFIFLPEAEKSARRHGRRLGDYIDRLRDHF